MLVPFNIGILVNKDNNESKRNTINQPLNHCKLEMDLGSSRLWE